MKKLPSVFLLFITLVTYSQDQFIKGNILNFESSEPLPYVNIGIVDKSVGTVSDKNGFFKLFLHKNVTSKDTIVVSHVGFKTDKFLVSDLNKLEEPVSLLPQNMELDEVVLNSKKIELKSKKIGRASKGLGLMHSNFYTAHEKSVDDRLSKEKGMKFTVRRNCYIKDLNFNITSNDFKSLKFRVNFYKIKDGLPTDLIVFENIIFEIRDNYLGWYTVDLEQYDIFFNEKIEEVAVTIQWLESIKTNEKSKYFAISTSSSPAHTGYFREKVMDRWNKAGQNLSFYLNAMCE